MSQHLIRLSTSSRFLNSRLRLSAFAISSHISYNINSITTSSVALPYLQQRLIHHSSVSRTYIHNNPNTIPDIPSTQDRTADEMGSIGVNTPVARGIPDFSLQGKVIIVSGGARGLGLCQAEALLEAGAAVHVIDRLESPSEDFVKAAARAKNEWDTSLTYHRADVRDVVSLNALMAQIADHHGRIDGLLAAAGIQQETPALDYTVEDCDRMMGVNVTGVLMTAQAVARQMIRLNCKGSLALIASMSGTVANRGLICPAYNASKAAVIQLARNLASEWGPHGIRVNTISPGYIVTAMTASLFDTYPERREDWPKGNMLNRLSTPEDFRGAGVFLLSDASSFMTGSDLRIDGGHAAW